MRITLLGTFCLIALTGCVNFAGMKTQRQPLQSAELNQHHTYPLPGESLKILSWWTKFNDPQLNQLIAVALADSPTMQVAEDRIKRASRAVDRDRANLWPTVDASGFMQRQRFSSYGLVPPPFNGRTFNIGELGLNFNYEIDFWGKNRQSIAARVSEAYALAADQRQARLILAVAVANTYFQLLNNQAQFEAAKKMLQGQEAIYKIFHARSSHGVDSTIPLSAEISNVEAIRLRTEQYAAAAKLSSHQLALLLGKNALTTDISVQAKNTHQSVDITFPAFLPANLLAQRPDIEAARFRVEAAAHRINVAKARFFPNVNLNALFSYQNVGYGHMFSPASQNNLVGAAFDLPIFDAGQRRADLGVRDAEYDVAVGQYNQTILTALREVADQTDMLKSLHVQLKIQSASTKAASKKYSLISKRYQHGIENYEQVLTSQVLYLQEQATQDYLQMQQRQTIALLYKALGYSA